MYKKFDLSLSVLGAIAQCTPSQPVKAETLADRFGLSVSYVELLLRTLRAAGYVVSVRGPGGGFLPGARLSRASAFDVYCLFSEQDAASAGNSTASAQQTAVADICLQMKDIGEAFLRDYPLAKLLEHAPAPQPMKTPEPNAFKLRPAAPVLRPNAPNSIFDLARFGNDDASAAGRRGRARASSEPAALVP